MRSRLKGRRSIAVAAGICSALLASSPASAAERGTRCSHGEIRTASGCTSSAAAGREIRAIVNRSVANKGLRAAITGVD
jgi:hypothetical protein